LIARIRRNFDFLASIYHENETRVVSVNMLAYFDLYDINPDDQLIALERIKLIVSDCLENSVFIEDSEKKAIDQFRALGIRTCTLPEEPYDQIIALAIFNKINAVTEGKMVLTNLIFKASGSDEVEYCFDNEEEHQLFMSKSDWWNESSTRIDNHKPNKKEKIVNIKKAKTDWAEVELCWSTPHKPETSEIIFTLETEKS